MSIMASKKCSKKKCKRMHTTKYKSCPACRAYSRKSMRKRKRLAVEQNVLAGHRLCTGCLHIKPEDQFISRHARRKKPTVQCQQCRDILYRSSINPETCTGRCRQVWLDWKKDKTCAHCGSSEAIEADHLGEKVHECSHIGWWTCHGGPEALKKELAKCQPLCMPCHRIKSKKERGVQTHPRILRLRKIINDEKIRVAACECGGRVGRVWSQSHTGKRLHVRLGAQGSRHMDHSDLSARLQIRGVFPKTVAARKSQVQVVT